MTAKTPRTRKAKGARFQKQVVGAILNVFRDLTIHDVRSIPSSVPGPDIWFSEHARNRIPLDIECKAQERFDIWSAIQQAEERGKDNIIPSVFFKRNRSKPYICMNINDFLRILERATHYVV